VRALPGTSSAKSETAVERIAAKKHIAKLQFISPPAHQVRSECSQRLFAIAANANPAITGAVITHAMGLAKLRVQGIPVRFGTKSRGFSGL
jgi:hypothetical protein